MVKSKTPKVTYFSDQAKCMLMESSEEDFEAVFYTGINNQQMHVLHYMSKARLCNIQSQNLNYCIAWTYEALCGDQIHLYCHSKPAPNQLQCQPTAYWVIDYSIS